MFAPKKEFAVEQRTHGPVSTRKGPGNKWVFLKLTCPWYWICMGIPWGLSCGMDSGIEICHRYHSKYLERRMSGIFWIWKALLYIAEQRLDVDSAMAYWHLTSENQVVRLLFRWPLMKGSPKYHWSPLQPSTSWLGVGMPMPWLCRG